jgi:hypothetical protein
MAVGVGSMMRCGLGALLFIAVAELLELLEW